MATYLISGDSYDYTIKPWAYVGSEYSSKKSNTVQSIHLLDYYNGQPCNVTIEKQYDSVGAFEGYTNLESVQGGNIVNSDCENMFAHTTSLTAVTSKFPNLTNAKKMFYCSGVDNLPASISYTGISDSSFMFDGCDELTSINTKLDFVNVQNAESMFMNCLGLTSATVNLPQAENIKCLFDNCQNLQSLTLGVPNATQADLAFCNLDSLSELDIKNVPMNADTTLDFGWFGAGGSDDITGLTDSAIQSCMSNFLNAGHTTGSCKIIPTYSYLTTLNAGNEAKSATEAIGFTLAGYPFQWYDTTNNVKITDTDLLNTLYNIEDTYVGCNVNVQSGPSVETWKDNNSEAQYDVLPVGYYGSIVYEFNGTDEADSTEATGYTVSDWTGHDDVLDMDVTYYPDSLPADQVTSSSLTDATITALTPEFTYYEPTGEWEGTEDASMYENRDGWDADNIPSETADTPYSVTATFTGVTSYTYSSWEYDSNISIDGEYRDVDFTNLDEMEALPTESEEPSETSFTLSYTYSYDGEALGWFSVPYIDAGELNEPSINSSITYTVTSVDNIDYAIDAYGSAKFSKTYKYNKPDSSQQDYYSSTPTINVDTTANSIEIRYEALYTEPVTGSNSNYFSYSDFVYVEDSLYLSLCGDSVSYYVNLSGTVNTDTVESTYSDYEDYHIISIAPSSEQTGLGYGNLKVTITDDLVTTSVTLSFYNENYSVDLDNSVISEDGSYVILSVTKEYGGYVSIDSPDAGYGEASVTSSRVENGNTVYIEWSCEPMYTNDIVTDVTYTLPTYETWDITNSDINAESLGTVSGTLDVVLKQNYATGSLSVGWDNMPDDVNSVYIVDEYNGSTTGSYTVTGDGTTEATRTASENTANYSWEMRWDEQIGGNEVYSIDLSRIIEETNYYTKVNGSEIEAIAFVGETFPASALTYYVKVEMDDKGLSYAD